MRRYRLFLILLSILFLLFLSCEEENAGPPTSPSAPPMIESITIPQKMALGSDYFHRFQVTLNTGAFEGTISCELFDSLGISLGLFTLHDDANAYTISGEPDFASSTSGDVVAGDGVFTRRVNSTFAGYEGVFSAIFRALAADSTFDTTATATVSVYVNDPPQLANPAPALDSLESGFAPFDLNMLVVDPQGREDIVEVKFELFIFGLSLDLEYYLEDPEMDSVFTYHFESSFAAGLTTDDYDFRFSAKDSLGAESFLPDLSVYIENGAPQLSDGATEPDSAMIAPDPGDTTEVVVTVVVDDPQTLLDIESVYINYERPPQHQPPETIWTYGYPMADNGLPWDLEKYLIGEPYLGDETAGDGIYTFTKLYTSDVDTGLHRFHIHCLDGAGQEADSLTVDFRVYY